MSKQIWGQGNVAQTFFERQFNMHYGLMHEKHVLH